MTKTNTILTDAEAKQGLLQEYSDAYKYSMGFRPKSESLWVRLEALTTMELYNEVQELYAAAERQAAWEAEIDRQEKVAKAEIDRQEKVAKAEARAIEARIAHEGIGPELMGPLAAALQGIGI